MNGNKNRNDLLCLILFAFTFELIFNCSIFCFHNKNTLNNSNKFYTNLLENESYLNNKIIKVNLNNRKIKYSNSFFQLKNNDMMLMNMEISLGIKQYLHFHPSVIQIKFL